MRTSTHVLLGFGLMMILAANASAQPGGFGKGQFGKGGFKGFDKKDEPRPSDKAPRWEYRVEYASALGGRGDLATGLNKLGSEGWELAGIESSNDKGRSSLYIFRRPYTGPAKADATKPAPESAPKEKADAKLEVRMFVLKNANAQEVAALVMDIFRTNRSDPIRVAADPRTNQVIINATPEMQNEIAAIIQRLDTADAAAQPGGKKKFLNLPGGGK